ncbi:hypothetical protein [Actinomyces urogenitalis]|uniref:hypothetical protein n=1 Tax=Actinomyces urogenitalis TaxID=103621 RepID=UPI0029102CC2|nr:hypothetical protein [Actinomyces urogenitalis]MDU5427449.1 hypothetical protein [Actinomyces urogenitalis]
MTTTQQRQTINSLRTHVSEDAFAGYVRQASKCTADTDTDRALDAMSTYQADRLITYLTEHARTVTAARRYGTCHYCGLPLDRSGWCEECGEQVDLHDYGFATRVVLAR